MPGDPTAVGLALGVIADVLVGDPRRGHPVAAFGRAATALEHRLYADRRGAGVVFTGTCLAATAGVGALAARASGERPLLRTILVATATWAVLGGTSLAREGSAMAAQLDDGDLAGARYRLRNLCARDGAEMTGPELARASVESLAENASDAVVAPLFWGAVAGLPGLLGYRAVNTLDAMVGYRNDTYRRFGWAAARADDLANWVPARLSAVVLAGSAPVAAGSVRRAWRVARRDAAAHPSPNAGHPEAAVAGALGVRLGGANTYHGQVERRPVLGAEGVAVTVADLRRTVRMVRAATLVAATGSVAARVAVRAAAREVAGRRCRPDDRTSRWTTDQLTRPRRTTRGEP